MAAPTLRQMRARMNSGHRIALEYARDGKKYTTQSIGDARGYDTCRTTLERWGCIENNQLTESGCALLSEYLRANPGARST